MAPRVLAHPGARPTENGETLWTPKSLAHPTRTLPLRITTTTPLTRTTPASSVPAPAWTAGCSLAALSSPSTTLMARSSSTSACRAAVARIADSPAPIAYAATPSEGATRADIPDGLEYPRTTEENMNGVRGDEQGAGEGAARREGDDQAGSRRRSWPYRAGA